MTERKKAAPKVARSGTPKVAKTKKAPKSKARVGRHGPGILDPGIPEGVVRVTVQYMAKGGLVGGSTDVDAMLFDLRPQHVSEAAYDLAMQVAKHRETER
jgi:hypothetical protein